jgi:hypothetical protein
MTKSGGNEDIFIAELVKELKYVSKQMKNEDNLEKKVYLYSAAYGITSRTFRYAFSRNVLLMDIVFNATYTMLLERIRLLKQGDLNVNPEILSIAIVSIEKYLSTLARQLDKNQDVYETLERILAAGFATTGPGNYIFEKGAFKI